MSTTYEQFVSLVETKIADGKPYVQQYGTSRGLSSSDLVDRLISESNAIAARHIPRLKIADVNGNGTRDYLLNQLDDWSESISEVARIYYPISTDPTVELIPYPNAAWAIEWRTSVGEPARALIFKESIPSAGETVRIHYTAPHNFTPTEQLTIPDSAAGAFADYIAGRYLLTAVSPAFLQHIDRYIGADSVSNLSPPGEVRATARVLINSWWEYVGIDPDRPDKDHNRFRQWAAGGDGTARTYWYAADGKKDGE